MHSHNPVVVSEELADADKFMLGEVHWDRSESFIKGWDAEGVFWGFPEAKELLFFLLFLACWGQRGQAWGLGAW